MPPVKEEISPGLITCDASLVSIHVPVSRCSHPFVDNTYNELFTTAKNNIQSAWITEIVYMSTVELVYFEIMI